MAQGVQCCAHDLWLTAQAVGVLNPVAVFVRMQNLAAGQQLAVHRGNGYLACLPARAVDALVKGLQAALGGIHRQGAGDHGGVKAVFNQEQPFQGQRGGHLRAVEQGQPFLWSQLNGGQAAGRQRFGSRYFLSLIKHVTNADHGAAEVGQRGQVSRGAHRTLFGNQRIDTVVEHGQQQFQGAWVHARMALCQADDFQRHAQPGGVFIHRLSDPGGVRNDQVSLQRIQLFARDFLTRQQAEAGINAVDGLATVGDEFDGLAGASDALPQHRVDGQCERLLPEASQISQGKAVFAQAQGGCCCH